MKKLAIKGHETRGKEVIEILEMLGGKNEYQVTAIRETHVYFVDGGIISFLKINQLLPEQFIVFTLEEFLEKYPYKVGDFVRIPEYESEVRICKMRWSEFVYVEYLVYRCDDEEWYTADELNDYNEPYEEETMEERKYADLRLDVDQDDKLATEATIDGNKITPPENYLIGKITQVDNGMLVEFVKKQPKFPKTYKECCDILGYNASYDLNNITTHDCVYDYKLQTLYKLLICRDAYRKIAGEQMGLKEPWKPEWNWREYKFCIVTLYDKIEKSRVGSQNYILAFPTEEICDIFFENFKELIEECKELL